MILSVYPIIPCQLRKALNASYTEYLSNSAVSTIFFASLKELGSIRCHFSKSSIVFSIVYGCKIRNDWNTHFFVLNVLWFVSLLCGNWFVYIWMNSFIFFCEIFLLYS